MNKLRLLLIVLWTCLAAGAAPAQPAEAPGVDRLLRDLNAPDFPTREQAQESITALAPEHLPALEAALADKALPPESRSRLEAAIQPVRWRARLHADQDRIRQWAMRTTVTAYEKKGRRNPAWDAQAIEALTALAWANINPLLRDHAKPRDRFPYKKPISEYLAVTNGALAAGCDDPLVRFAAIHAHTVQPQITLPIEELHRRYTESADGMEAAGYDLIWVATARAVAMDAEIAMLSRNPARFDDRMPVLQKRLRNLLAQAAQAARDSELPKGQLLELLDILRAQHSRLHPDPAAFLEAAKRELTATMPGQSFPYAYAGHGYVAEAGNARGGRFAQATPAQRFAEMNRRLQVARPLLMKAYELDPTDPLVPRAMNEMILISSGDREEMELWYRRAIANDPNDYEIARKKMYFLEPRWHGSAEEMLAFGRECAATQNYDAKIPLLLMEAHLSLSTYVKDGIIVEPGQSYFRNNPQVWKDVQPVVEAYLKRFPDDARVRAYFALIGGYCGKLDDVRPHFERLQREDPAMLQGVYGRHLNFWRKMLDLPEVEPQVGN